MGKDIDFKDNIVKRNKIPILIYVPEWIQLFSGNKSRNMQKIISGLEVLIARNKECDSELYNLEKRKKTVMNKILYLSKDINENNNKTALSKMAEAEKEILEINKKIPVLLEELESIPERINDMNTQLLRKQLRRLMSL
mgnify:CR=1 FL=1